jgi:hypothetical protein
MYVIAILVLVGVCAWALDKRLCVKSSSIKDEQKDIRRVISPTPPVSLMSDEEFSPRDTDSMSENTAQVYLSEYLSKNEDQVGDFELISIVRRVLSINGISTRIILKNPYDVRVFGSLSSFEKLVFNLLHTVKKYSSAGTMLSVSTMRYGLAVAGEVEAPIPPSFWDQGETSFPGIIQSLAQTVSAEVSHSNYVNKGKYHVCFVLNLLDCAGFYSVRVDGESF